MQVQKWKGAPVLFISVWLPGLVYDVVEIYWLQLSYNAHWVVIFPRQSFAHNGSRYDPKFTLSSQRKRGRLNNEMWQNHPSVLRFVCGQVPLYVISQVVMTCDSAAATVVAREWLRAQRHK